MATAYEHPREVKERVALDMIGLGRMGANLVRRLMRGGHECVVYDVNPQSVRRLETRDRVARSHPGVKRLLGADYARRDP